MNSDGASTTIYLEVELRLASPPRRQANLTLALSFLADKRLQPLPQYNFELSTPDGSGGGGFLRQNFSFQLGKSLLLRRLNSLPLPLVVEPLVRWGLQPCQQPNKGLLPVYFDF